MDVPESEYVQMEDVKVLSLTVLCFLFGLLFYKRIEGVEKRKWTGTSLGFVISLVVMGNHFWHLILSIVGAALLIVRLDRKKCHVIVFMYMMIYLTIIRLCCYNTNRGLYIHKNIIAMLVSCKLIGLAFEVHNSHKDGEEKKVYPHEHDRRIDPSFMEVLHYSFSYFGMLVGPYIRYRTYDDFIKLPFSKYADSMGYCKKMYYVPLYILLYAFLEHIWPIDYVLTDEFRRRLFIYKATYAVIQYQRFRFWMYSGLVMSECICSAAGLGAYPVQGQNKCTHGPTKGYDKLIKISPEDAEQLTYDFDTISNIDVFVVQTSPWISKYTMSWNKSIQYFMGMYIYRSLPKSHSIGNLRSFVTMVICAFWHGTDIGYQIGMITLPLYVPTERMFLQFHEKMNGPNAKVLGLIMYVVQYYVIGIGVMSFLLLDIDKILRYHTSLQFLPFLFMICLHMLGVFLLMLQREKKMRYTD